MSPVGEPEETFTLSQNEARSEVVISVRGRLDEPALLELVSLFDTVIAGDHSSAVLDLTEMESLAATGPAVIASAAQHLHDQGRRLTIRSPSTPIIGPLVAEGLGDFIVDDEFELTPRRAGGPSAVVARVPDNADLHESRRFTERASAIPTDTDLVDATLRLVVELARTTVAGADGVSVSLRRHGQLATVAASDETILEMDANQYATGEGPCVDASIKGRRFHAPSLDDEARWPDFTPKARALGIRAILSSPLVAHSRPVGALNIYSLQSSAFDADDQSLAMRFATEVSAILTDAGVDISDDRRSERFQASLRSREIIAQAQGVIMDRQGITEEEAYTVLRVHSQRTGVSLRAWALEVTESTRPGHPKVGPRRDDGLRG
jgi:anti-anti-sigma regulatory factor